MASRKRRLAKLRASWAVADASRRRDFDAIGSLHEALPKAPLDLSESTAADLDVRELFVSLDRTLTEPGQQALHRLLRTPTIDLHLLGQRSAALRVLEADPSVRERLQLALWPLRDAAPGTLVPLARSEKLALPLPRASYVALSLAAVASLCFWALAGGPGFMAVAAAYVINAVAHYSAERVVAQALPGVLSLQQLFGAARRLAGEALPGLEPQQERLRKLLAALAPLGSAVGRVTVLAAPDDLAVYVNLFVLRQVRLLARAGPLLVAHRREVLELIEAVGTFDALQAVASFRAEHPGWCEPELDAAFDTLEARDVRHPLVPDAVPNTIALRGGALITGSNMAGKSTFLRTIGVNALLSQTFHFCLASRWRAPPLRLATSLRRSDDLLAGRSYYLAEAQGILEALRAAEGQPRTLCVLDEIFRGTNTAERIAASAEVLRWLVDRGAFVLAATHDDALTGMLDGAFRNLHFGETLDEQGMVFDYLLKEGRATTRNAIELLRILGYPQELVEAARARLRE